MSALEQFFDLYGDHAGLQALRPAAQHPLCAEEQILLARQAAPLLAAELGARGFAAAELQLYQQLFREMETLIARGGSDGRHSFIVVIPVADRPEHLQGCLQSLLELCRLYHYGGCVDGRFSRVSAMIADDSREPRSISSNREIARRCSEQGLETHYFGSTEQLRCIDQLTRTQRSSLRRVIGDFAPGAFYHKGASMMRNIAYLQLNAMRDGGKRLFYFIDSDQEFKVRVTGDGDARELYAINYFHELDSIFSAQEVSVLTGKVVGDPPVSPAVMAGTFLDDVIALVEQLAASRPGDACRFHGHAGNSEHEAAYHDMAELFGFKTAGGAYRYRCPLEGEHDHSSCLAEFSTSLQRFFHGEHPTRKRHFDHQPTAGETTPARTIYTGNYLFDERGLDYFIPFAMLRLRMAGPVLGRLVRSQLGDGFVSANLPMLHKRTMEHSGQAEFRPGVQHDGGYIDLSEEFERQFYGDVMLFTIERLIELGYPRQRLPRQRVGGVIGRVDGDMRRRYAHKQRLIMHKCRRLSRLFFDSGGWWKGVAELADSEESFTRFVHNIESNFGAEAGALRLVESRRRQRHAEMLEALLAYADDRRAWHEALETLHPKAGAIKPSTRSTE